MSLEYFTRNLAWNLIYKISSEVGIDSLKLLKSFRMVTILWRCYMDNSNNRVRKLAEEFIRYSRPRLTVNELSELDSTLDLVMRKYATVRWFYEKYGLLDPPYLRLIEREDGSFKLETVRNIAAIINRIDIDRIIKYYREETLRELARFSEKITSLEKYRKIEHVYTREPKIRIEYSYDYAFHELVKMEEVRWRYESGRTIIPYIYRLVNGIRRVRDYLKQHLSTILENSQLLGIEPDPRSLMLEDRQLIDIIYERELLETEEVRFLEEARKRLNILINDLYRDSKIIIDLYNKVLTILTRRLEPFTLYYTGRVKYRSPFLISLKIEENEKELYIMNCLDHLELYITSSVPIVERFYPYHGSLTELYNINHSLELLLNIDNIIKGEPTEPREIEKLKEDVKKIVYKYL